MFQKVTYARLNARQQENYNFHIIAARLAEYGFNSVRLTDDFEGADFIALHVDGTTMLRIQLKGRLTFDQKYYGKGIHIAFRDDADIYVYPHDELRQLMEDSGCLVGSKSEAWVKRGSRSWNILPNKYKPLLQDYLI